MNAENPVTHAALTRAAAPRPLGLSLVIPVYNGARHIRTLLDSLLPQLDADCELLVVDDASTDDTAAILAGYPQLTVLHHAANRGVGAARNTGAQAARGELVMFLDADTEATPGLLAAAREFFASRPEVAAASGVYSEQNPDFGAFATYLDACESAMRDPALDRPARGMLSGSLCLLRRDVLESLGGFSEDRRVALEDDELGLRLAQAGHVHWLLGGLRVRHWQPAPLGYLRELVPRTRSYLALLRQHRHFNEIMGGSREGLARLAYAAALLLLVPPLLAPGAVTGGAALLSAGFAGWLNRGWLRRFVDRRGWRLLPLALCWHAASTLAICSGALLGVADQLRDRLRRAVIDAAVVAAYLRSLLTPGAGGYLIQFLTHRCPADCRHCFDHPQRAAIGRADELDLARIRRLAASAGPLGHVSLTGGEPLLRDDLVEILQAWHAAGVYSISLLTSGAYPEKLSRVLTESLATMPYLRLIVTVSVDALGADHDRLRRMPGLFSKLQQCLSRLQTLKMLWPQLRVHGCLTLSADNAAGAEATLRWMQRWPFDQLELNTLRGEPADPALAAAPRETYDRLRALLGDAGRSSRGLARLFSRLDDALFGIVRHWQSPWPCGTCLAGRRLAVIQADGEVLPCEMLRSMRPADAAAQANFSLGHLGAHADDLRALLASPQARQITDYIAASNCRCSFECAIFATLAYRPWRLPRLMFARRPGAPAAPVVAAKRP